jgi:uncharacterized protein involved in exopolysaccharide biosynthesis
MQNHIISYFFQSISEPMKKEQLFAEYERLLERKYEIINSIKNHYLPNPKIAAIKERKSSVEKHLAEMMLNAAGSVAQFMELRREKFEIDHIIGTALKRLLSLERENKELAEKLAEIEVKLKKLSYEDDEVFDLIENDPKDRESEQWRNIYIQ